MFISKIYNNTNLQIPCLYVGCTPIYLNFKYYEEVEVFSWKTTSEKGQIEIYSYIDRLLYCLYLMLSLMKIIQYPFPYIFHLLMANAVNIFKENMNM